MSNIDAIGLSKGNKDDKLMPVVVRFKEATTWTSFTIEDLLEILRLWIIGEEMKYPQKQGYKGRWMLFDEIKKVFDETPVK